jgi:hypothetical protein
MSIRVRIVWPSTDGEPMPSAVAPTTAVVPATNARREDAKGKKLTCERVFIEASPCQMSGMAPCHFECLEPSSTGIEPAEVLCDCRAKVRLERKIGCARAGTSTDRTAKEHNLGRLQGSQASSNTVPYMTSEHPPSSNPSPARKLSRSNAHDRAVGQRVRDALVSGSKIINDRTRLRPEPLDFTSAASCVTS